MKTTAGIDSGPSDGTLVTGRMNVGSNQGEHIDEQATSNMAEHCSGTFTVHG